MQRKCLQDTELRNSLTNLHEIKQNWLQPTDATNLHAQLNTHEKKPQMNACYVSYFLFSIKCLQENKLPSRQCEILEKTTHS